MTLNSVSDQIAVKNKTQSARVCLKKWSVMCSVVSPNPAGRSSGDAAQKHCQNSNAW